MSREFITEEVLEAARSQAAVQVLGKSFGDLAGREKLKTGKTARFIMLAAAPFLANAVREADAEALERAGHPEAASLLRAKVRDPRAGVTA